MVARRVNLDVTVESTVTNSEKLDMAANNEKLERTEEDKAANYLMLISRVGGIQESRVYRCKTCMKEFSSFQSLGGHRASHNKHVNNGNSSDEQSSLSSGPVAKKKKTNKNTNTGSHRCPICGVDFPMGQALGGHMRKHRNEEDASGALVTRSFFPEAATTTMFTTLKKSSSGKRVACLDLVSDAAMDSRINLELELGRTMY